MHRLFAFTAVVFLSLTSLAFAQDDRFSFGGDEHAAGNQAAIATLVDRDAFAAGFNVQITDPVAGDAHAAGYSVVIRGDVTGNIYAMGNSVAISGRVGQDVSATGTNILIAGTKGIAGNARLAGGNVVISAPISGTVTLVAGSAILDAPVAGDFYFGGDNIKFSDQALILGNVTIESSSDVIVPESVASADRVTIEKIEPYEIAVSASDIAQQSIKGFWPIWVPIIAALVIFLIASVIWLALFPKRSLIAYRVAMAKPWKSLLLGMFGLATFMGLVPVVAMTVIGIPLIPVVVIALILAGLIGYIAGTWFLATKVLAAFGFGSESVSKRVIAMIVGLLIAWALSIIPFIGWLIQLVLVFLGLGAVVLAALARWTDASFHTKITKEVTASMAG